MQDESFTGEALEKALVNDELSEPGLELLGMVKASDQKGHVSFTASGCDDWIDIPTKMIEQAERVGSSQCKDHSHPVFKLILKESKNSEAQILSALLAQRGAAQHARPIPTEFSQIGRRGPFGGDPGFRAPTTNVAFWPVGDGSWRCVGWGDCLNLASQVSGGHFKCEPGWATGEMVCTWTP
jgi:hypothetical protein